MLKQLFKKIFNINKNINKDIIKKDIIEKDIINIKDVNRKYPLGGNMPLYKRNSNYKRCKK